MRRNGLPPRSRLQRATEGAKVLGVCAGVADYFGFDRNVVRAVTVVCALFFPTTILAYFILGLVLDREPEQERKTSAYQSELRRRVRSQPHSTLHSQRHRFRELDRRLQKLEKYVTSKRFRLDREFDGLQD
jgi:phage shock protein C